MNAYLYLYFYNSLCLSQVIEHFMNERIEEAPDGMTTMFQTDTIPSGVGWTWMDVEDALVRPSTFTGLTVEHASCVPGAT